MNNQEVKTQWQVIIRRDSDGEYFRETEDSRPNLKTIYYWEDYHQGVVVNTYEVDL